MLEHRPHRQWSLPTTKLPSTAGPPTGKMRTRWGILGRVDVKISEPCIQLLQESTCNGKQLPARLLHEGVCDAASEGLTQPELLRGCISRTFGIWPRKVTAVPGSGCSVGADELRGPQTPRPWSTDTQTCCLNPGFPNPTGRDDSVLAKPMIMFAGRRFEAYDGT